jgi:hypothetical protein
MKNKMMRILIGALIFFIMASVSNATPYCDKYRFGSPEWWTCKQNQLGG